MPKKPYDMLNDAKETLAQMAEVHHQRADDPVNKLFDEKDPEFKEIKNDPKVKKSEKPKSTIIHDQDARQLAAPFKIKKYSNNKTSKSFSFFIVAFRYPLLISLMLTILFINFFSVSYSLERLVIDVISIATFLTVTIYCHWLNKKMAAEEADHAATENPLPHNHINPLTVTAEYASVEETLHSHPETFSQPNHAYDGKDQLVLPDEEEDEDK